MARSVKAKIVPCYVWACPGCGESNLDSKDDREVIHSECEMDYISVKCSNCNGSYVIEGSCGWLTRWRNKYGFQVGNPKQVTL